MNKTTIFLIFIFVLLLGAVMLFSFNDDSEPIAITDVVYTDLNVTFKPTEGSDIILDNFLKNPSVKADEENPGFYELGNTFPTEESPDLQPSYVVMYDRSTGTFGITLLQKPFNNSRLEAEAYLKDLLKVDEKEMCKLPYTVAVPGYIDQNASGQDYRFSFCPGSVSL